MRKADVCRLSCSCAEWVQMAACCASTGRCLPVEACKIVIVDSGLFHVAAGNRGRSKQLLIASMEHQDSQGMQGQCQPWETVVVPEQQLGAEHAVSARPNPVSSTAHGVPRRHASCTFVTHVFCCCTADHGTPLWPWPWSQGPSWCMPQLVHALCRTLWFQGSLKATNIHNSLKCKHHPRCTSSTHHCHHTAQLFPPSCLAPGRLSPVLDVTSETSTQEACWYIHT
jgi:hypothetical protein